MTVRRGGQLRWDIEGRDWPHHELSSFVYAAGLRWHVQSAGSGPAILLLHGTGASTHTWRDVLPLLAARHRVVAVDLPGHAFSDPLPAAQAGLDGMAAALGALLQQMAVQPFAIVGQKSLPSIG